MWKGSVQLGALEGHHKLFLSKKSHNDNTKQTEFYQTDSSSSSPELFRLRRTLAACPEE